MDIIDVINQGRNSFIIKYGLDPKTIYVGRIEKKTVDDYILANYGYEEKSEDKLTIGGLKVIAVKDESHFKFGVE